MSNNEPKAMTKDEQLAAIREHVECSLRTYKTEMEPYFGMHIALMRILAAPSAELPGEEVTVYRMPFEYHTPDNIIFSADEFKKASGGWLPPYGQETKCTMYLVPKGGDDGK